MSFATSEGSDVANWSEPASLGSSINTSFADQQAALAKDGLTLYFASARPPASAGSNDIWVSHRACVGTPAACPWEPPANLGAPVNTTLNEAGPAFSRDGHWLFFASNRTGSAGANDIWAAYREHVHDDFGWQQPMNLGPGVNTTIGEAGPSHFENDEQGAPQLFFNRGGDIRMSQQDAAGSWSSAVLVTELNSPFTDQRVSIKFNGRDIYFWSDRTGTTRLWTSSRASVSDPWAPPAEVGAPVSGADPAGEVFPHIFSRGRTEELYFVRTVPGSGFDLFVSTRERP
jgi:hypothetical protein